MNSIHKFNLHLDWESTESNNSTIVNKTIKNHIIKIIGKDDLHVSAAKAFKGDSKLYNPEDLLLASLTSCHMMSYLYCCSQHKIQILSYEDNAEALLEVNADGSGRIVKVVLQPVVELLDDSQRELALSLHSKANKLCFIANSCNFPVEHRAQVIISNQL